MRDARILEDLGEQEELRETTIRVSTSPSHARDASNRIPLALSRPMAAPILSQQAHARPCRWQCNCDSMRVQKIPLTFSGSDQGISLGLDMIAGCCVMVDPIRDDGGGDAQSRENRPNKCDAERCDEGVERLASRERVRRFLNGRSGTRDGLGAGGG